MARIYGERWEIVETLGEGGQSDVFRARDLRGEFKELVALKRIRNPRRRDRFLDEIEAIKRLDHPNVIKLIDHSALESGSASGDKQFLVMPIASGGDLTKCAQRFAGNLDGTRIAAYQLASALAEAHKNGVIHRDVKPQNVLFPDAGNSLWLTDFGICLISDGPRNTYDNEVVGPWSFIAPELEGGGQLEVTPAADVYSLGKLIYYMISGGVNVPRERLGEPQYAHVFKDGGRFNLMRMLLEKMVCPLDGRLVDMQAVLLALEEISDYDRRSIIAPLTAKTSNKIERLRALQLEEQRIAHANTLTRKEQDDRESRARVYILDWLGAELDKVSEIIGAGGVVKNEVIKRDDQIYLSMDRSYGRVDLSVEDGSQRCPSTHVLEVHVCHSTDGVVIVRHGNQPIAEERSVDRSIVVIPIYRRVFNVAPASDNRNLSRFYIGPNSELLPLPNLLLPGHFAPRGTSQAARSIPKRRGFSFKISEWPSVDEQLRAYLTSACESFIDIIERKRGDPF